MTNSKIAWLTVIVGCLTVTALLTAIQLKPFNKEPALFEPVTSVELVIARAASWQPSVDVTAELIAIEDVEISNELAGRVVQLGAEPGQQVERGDLLFKFDTREEEADLQAARADAKLARLALDRNQRLKKTGAASAEALDQASAVFSSTQARVKGLQTIIDKKTLRAPFAGTIGLHQLSLGQYLDEGTIITRLIGTKRGVWVDFNLPQHQATLTVGDTITVDARRLHATTLSATVIARDAWIDTASRNVRYRALPDTHHQSLFPGALVSVSAALGAEQAAIAVPITAVQRDPYGTFVFSLNPVTDRPTLDRAQRRTVHMSSEHAQQAIIIEGLVPGERIAGDGAFKLRQGALVNATTKTTPTQGAD